MNFFRYYFRVQIARFTKEMSVGPTWFLDLMGSLVYVFLHIIIAQFIFPKFHFPGWSIAQMWVLFYTFEIFTYLAFLFFWRGLNTSVSEINTGLFDVVLNRPVQHRLFAFFRGGSSNNVFAVTLCTIFQIWTLWYWGFTVALPNILLYILFIGLSLWTLHCLSVIFISFNFWLGEISETRGIIFAFQEGFKYPAQCYEKTALFLQVLIVPFALLTTVPASLLIAKPIPISLWVIYSITFITLTLFSHILWTKGVRSYTSAA